MSEPTQTDDGDTVSFGYEYVTPEEKTRRVGEVFTSVAKKYDIMNDAMSFVLLRRLRDFERSRHATVDDDLDAFNRARAHRLDS